MGGEKEIEKRGDVVKGVSPCSSCSAPSAKIRNGIPKCDRCMRLGFSSLSDGISELSESVHLSSSASVSGAAPKVEDSIRKF